MKLQGRIDRPWRFFAIGIVLVIAVLFYADWRAFQASTTQVDQARQFVRQTNSVLSSIKDAETGERGYLLTGDPKYLAPYNNGLQGLPGELTDLQKTAETARRNQSQVKRIHALIDDKLTEMSRAIQVRDEQGEDAAIAFVRTDEGQLTMDEVRTACQLLTSGEAADMYQRTRTSEMHANRSRAVVLAGCLALTILLFRLGAVTDAVVAEREEFASTVEESRQLLQTTLASIGDAVIVSEADGRIRFMNPVAESITGWGAAEAERRSLDEVFKVTRENRDTPGTAAVNFVLKAKDGQQISIDQSSAPIRDVSGNVLGTVLVFRDVSRRRAAERELARWKEIFSGAGFGMFVIDPSTGAIVDINPEFASMHGYSVSDLQGKPLACLSADAGAAPLAGAVEKAGHDGRYMFEQTNRRRDGSEFAALIDMTTFFDHGREYCAGYCADVTEKKRFEDTLRESEERFRTLANVLPQMIWSTDREGRTEYVNEGWIAYAGWLSPNGTSHYPPDPWDQLVHPEDRESFLGRWKESVATGNVFEAQARLRRAEDGTSRWFLCRAVAVRDREGSIVRWLGGCTDVQQQVENASQLRRTNEALQHSNADLEQFAYAASHDLQEPLRMVSIYSELLKEECRGSLDDRAASYLDFAIGGAQRMSTLLKALLTYSRVTDAPPDTEGGGAAGQRKRCDANEALAAALLNLATVIDDTGAKIVSGPLPAVALAEIHLAQLFQNLIGNAIKYRREEYPAGAGPEVHVSAAVRTDGFWQFSVSDNGIGIEAEYLTQVFGLFKRLHGHTYEGTGIGLALCQKIVERAGGKIWVESTPGEGSTFLFTLPGVENMGAVS